jgi:hypothetical protein
MKINDKLENICLEETVPHFKVLQHPLQIGTRKSENLSQGKLSLGRGLLKYKKEIIITQPSHFIPRNETPDYISTNN